MSSIFEPRNVYFLLCACYICRFFSEYIIIYPGRYKCHLTIKLSIFENDDDDACQCRGILISQFCGFCSYFPFFAFISQINRQLMAMRRLRWNI